MNQPEKALIPERDLLLVRREPGNTSEYNGIILPPTARLDDHIAGIVLRSGSEALYDPGTRVVMARGSGTSFMLTRENEELAFIQSLDVLALWPDEESEEAAA